MEHRNGVNPTGDWHQAGSWRYIGEKLFFRFQRSLPDRVPSLVHPQDDCLALSSALSRIRSWHPHLSHEFKADTPNRATKTVLGAAEERSEVRRFTFPRRCCKTCGFWVGRRLGKIPLQWPKGGATAMWENNLEDPGKTHSLCFFVSRVNRTWKRSTLADSTRLSEPLGSHVFHSRTKLKPAPHLSQPRGWRNNKCK